MEGTFEVLHVIFCFVAGRGIVRGLSWRFVDSQLLLKSICIIIKGYEEK
jgi:hypothetical protein